MKHTEKRRWEWTQFNITATRKVRRTGHDWIHEERAAEAHIRYAGEFSVEVDISGLVQEAVNSAAHSKMGKSTRCGGLVKARRSHVQELSREERVVPIADGYEEIQPGVSA
jgi:hypothetical protein